MNQEIKNKAKFIPGPANAITLWANGVAAPDIAT